MPSENNILFFNVKLEYFAAPVVVVVVIVVVIVVAVVAAAVKPACELSYYQLRGAKSTAVLKWGRIRTESNVERYHCFTSTATIFAHASRDCD